MTTEVEKKPRKARRKTRYTEMIMVRLKPEQLAAMQDEVEREGTTMSIYVRQAVMARLAQRAAQQQRSAS